MQPIGSFLGGVIGSVFGIHTALIVACAGMFLAAAWVWLSPTSDLIEMPSGPAEELERFGATRPAG
ncbi:MAG: hypothetical protein M3440_07330 [Chloroflexota bacterium]|nr:hypothetical protein [Chloroflexota bacterium]